MTNALLEDIPAADDTQLTRALRRILDGADVDPAASCARFNSAF